MEECWREKIILMDRILEHKREGGSVSHLCWHILKKNGACRGKRLEQPKASKNKMLVHMQLSELQASE